ncbi:hypothetical protein [Gluconobacter cerinus]|uniref:hypothetical protein n=1 Tax=Gluconobacter cerinus TaxID=38307 RepID=UPI0007D960B1|nr:hypothetical protein [Gluconobacter cerinus]
MPLAGRVPGSRTILAGVDERHNDRAIALRDRHISKCSLHKICLLRILMFLLPEAGARGRVTRCRCQIGSRRPLTNTHKTLLLPAWPGNIFDVTTNTIARFSE